MLESVVSFPTRVALNVKLPCTFNVPPMTMSPLRFSLGILSPVTMLSSTEESPDITMPSTGIFSPGFTRRQERLPKESLK